ncbi:MAG: sorbosone dehydrogenase family protein [Pseudomonadota bacterium]|nr:sorbosone dehydrogenase family protein [Pseudomonadota bacterium]
MRNKVLLALGLIVLILFGLWFWVSRPDLAKLSVDAVTGKRPTITKPRDQIYPTFNVAPAVGWTNGAMPIPAAGLAVNAFATGLDHPRWLYRLPNGDVLVAETNGPSDQLRGLSGIVAGHMFKKAGADAPSANRITLLRDANGDGIAESRTVLIGGLTSPFGMALFGGYLYIGDTDALVRVPFTPGQTKIAAKPEIVVPLPHGGLHWTRNVVAAADGKTLFVTVGSSTNIANNGIAAEKDRADVLQVFPDTKTYRVYAAGMRNPNGLAIEPHSKLPWVTVNERDMMGSDLAPDYMSQIEPGDHFGWPWYYWGGYPDRRVDPPNPQLQQYSKRPDYALGPHVAALGLSFAADARLGPAFTNGAFIGEHGSWNRVPPSGYKVVYVPFGDDGFPAKGARPVDVLGGFLTAKGEAQGRPVGVITDATGALLVADDVGNTIWRVSAKAPAATP